MKVARYSINDETKIGIIHGETIIELDNWPSLQTDNRLGVMSVLQADPSIIEAIKASIASLPSVKMSDVTLLAPIPKPEKFLGLGFAFKSHIKEVLNKFPDIKLPQHQVWFNKQVSCITGPHAPIYMPPVSDQLDYEVELAVVIGKKCRYVKAENVTDVIAGYMICNDASIRDWQLRAPTAMIGKSFDTHGPTGPWVTSANSFPLDHDFNLRTWVNGELRQDGHTSDWAYSLGQMIEELTTAFTLEPGDILATGTPCGVGAACTPAKYLKIGDVVRMEIAGLGSIENTVVAEPVYTY
ncbi:fumarylacetoacetate hydrolase family protein [Kordiimonas pumila]|uniref:Fumarylacetoacetate hydrolase family protein n=1 Tax=Kordiimonas pumila TaxID=2161677 RepID=A0ABV7D538_9PROT|nr:fumarylacetoacetate hydrolase family protein [Kordiimonas pumila]